MEIENRLPEKQEAHDACNIVGFISIRTEVIGQCRRHQSSTSRSCQQWRGSQVGKAASLQGATASSNLVHASTSTKTPVRTPILAGAVTITAEAAMIADTFIIRLSAVNLNRRNHSDLPFMHSRV